jgi:hypothetical protein
MIELLMDCSEKERKKYYKNNCRTYFSTTTKPQLSSFKDISSNDT